MEEPTVSREIKIECKYSIMVPLWPVNGCLWCLIVSYHSSSHACHTWVSHALSHHLPLAGAVPSAQSPVPLFYLENSYSSSTVTASLKTLSTLPLCSLSTFFISPYSTQHNVYWWLVVCMFVPSTSQEFLGNRDHILITTHPHTSIAQCLTQSNP